MTTQTNNAPKSNNKNFYEDFAQIIIDQLEKGVAPWQKPWETGQVSPAFNPESGTVYKGINRVRLACTGQNDPRWMTFKQANDAGYKIKQGSKSTQIAYYQFHKEVNKLNDEGQPVLKEDGTVEKKKVALECPIIKISYAFNGNQIEGIPELEKKEIDWNPEEKAEKIIANTSASIAHDQRDKAFYRPLDDSIHMPGKEQFSDSAKYYSTILHEISHSTGHSSRMNRPYLSVHDSESYAKEELRAEIASWMISQETGIPHDPEQNVAYVSSWIKALKDDPMEIMRACRDAEKIKEYVMGLEHNKELSKNVEHIAEQGLQQDIANDVTNDIKSEHLAAEKTFLAVPFTEKEQAKKLGAKWDFENKAWFAPEGSNLAALQQWLPENVAELSVPAAKSVESPEDEFAQKIADLGLDLKGKLPICDGKIHRAPLIGRSNGNDGAYCVFTDSNHPAGWAQNFVSGEKTNLVATGHVLTTEEKAVQKADLARLRESREKEVAANKYKVAVKAQEVWNSLGEVKENNPYLENKGVPSFGLKQGDKQDLIVPVQNIEGEIRGLQSINEDGSKRFMPGMEKTGNFHLINPVNPDNNAKNLEQGEIIICEGYATGASLHMATNKTVVVAFDSGNLEPVAKNIREKYPNAKITICADNDHKLEAENGNNIGISKAEKAALAVGGKVKVPTLTAKDKTLGLTDFNDIHKTHGLEAVQKKLGIKMQQQKGLAR